MLRDLEFAGSNEWFGPLKSCAMGQEETHVSTGHNPIFMRPCQGLRSLEDPCPRSRYSESPKLEPAVGERLAGGSVQGASISPSALRVGPVWMFGEASILVWW